MVKALSTLYSHLIGRQINAETEFLVTVGAYEALYSTFMSLVDVGDEVIIIEPFFDCYEPMVKMAGGTPIFIPLCLSENSNSIYSSSDWILDMEELESKFSNKTKLIVINTPHNPLGKVCIRKKYVNLCNV